MDDVLTESQHLTNISNTINSFQDYYKQRGSIDYYKTSDNFQNYREIETKEERGGD